MIFDYIFMRNCIDLTHCCVSPRDNISPHDILKRFKTSPQSNCSRYFFWNLPPHDKTKPLGVTEKRKKEEKTT